MYAHAHRITEVGEDLQDHLVQPSTSPHHWGHVAASLSQAQLPPLVTAMQLQSHGTQREAAAIEESTHTWLLAESTSQQPA